MSGKKDSTRYTAAEGIAEAAGIEHPPQARSTATVSERKLHLVHNEPSRGGSMRAGPPSQRPPKGAGMLDRSQQERIGAVLRESFADIEKEPLPERLSKLIKDLHKEEKHR
jgi:hypothetical protein